MPTVPTTRTAIMQAIAEHGPMTADELAEHMHRTRQAIGGSIIIARKKHGTQYFRIVDWRRQHGTGGREAPVYGLGPGRDKPRPVLGEQARRETWERYDRKRRMMQSIRRRVVQRDGSVNPYMMLVQQ